jgi:hypothetical protein
MKQEATEGAQAQRLVETLIDYYDEVNDGSWATLSVCACECICVSACAYVCVYVSVCVCGTAVVTDAFGGAWVQLFLYSWLRIGQMPLSRKATLAAAAWLRAHPPNDNSAPAAAAFSHSARQQLQGKESSTLAGAVSNLDLSLPSPHAMGTGTPTATPVRDAHGSSINEEDEESGQEDEGSNEATLTRRETVQRYACTLSLTHIYTSM